LILGTCLVPSVVYAVTAWLMKARTGANASSRKILISISPESMIEI
jgi:hypothetical protein